LLLRYPQRKKYCDYGHSFRWLLKCRRNILWVKRESFFKYISTAKARCSTDQRFMATEMLWVSLEERSRTNSPRQRFHSQLFWQIIRYFCRTLYNRPNLSWEARTPLRKYHFWRSQKTSNDKMKKNNGVTVTTCLLPQFISLIRVLSTKKIKSVAYDTANFISYSVFISTPILSCRSHVRLVLAADSTHLSNHKIDILNRCNGRESVCLQGGQSGARAQPLAKSRSKTSARQIAL
jgi:hypothetical protein